MPYTYRIGRPRVRAQGGIAMLILEIDLSKPRNFLYTSRPAGYIAKEGRVSDIQDISVAIADVVEFHHCQYMVS
jgi:hypothetical protein